MSEAIKALTPKKTEPMVFRVGEGLEKEPTVSAPGPTVARARALAAGQPVKTTPLSTTGERVASSVSSAVIASETAKKVPSVAPRTTAYNMDVPGIAANVTTIRPAFRLLASFGLDVKAGARAIMTGNRMEPIITPSTPFQRMLLGNEPIVARSTKLRADEKMTAGVLTKLGVDKDISTGASLAIAPLFMAAGMTLDLTPFGGGEKAAGKVAGKIALSRNADEIYSLLAKTYKNGEKDLIPLAKSLVDVRSPDDVIKILDGFSSAGKTVAKAMGKSAKSEYVPPNSFINIEKLGLDDEGKASLKAVLESHPEKVIGPKGSPLTHREIVSAANDASADGKLLRTVITREDTERMAARELATRNALSNAERTFLNKDSAAAVKKAALDDIFRYSELLSSDAADAGRRLNAKKIGSETIEKSRIDSVVARIRKAGADMEKVRESAGNVDWNDAKAVDKFFREFVKPTFSDVLTEYRYNNMLSSPRTFARNALGNLITTAVARPATLGAESLVDLATYATTLGRKGTAKSLMDLPRYYIDAGKSIPRASRAFMDSWAGKSAMTFADMEERVPVNAAWGPIAKSLWDKFRIPTKALEATDRMMMTLVSEAEKARLVRNGMSVAKAEDEAERISKYWLLRQGFDEKSVKGEGHVLKALSETTGWLDSYMAQAKSGKALKWFVPFVRTPMNLAKMWIEFSPVGLTTIPGSRNKKEQLAKALVGSTLSYLGFQMALDDRTTWGIPTDPEAKRLFFASGKKPYSVKVGDSWIPMMYAGPWAFALALPAALRYHDEESPEALTNSQIKKISKSVGSLAELLSSQTFMEGIGNFVDIVRGDPDANVEKALAFNSSQLVPMSGLLRWVSTIVDDTYRKADSFAEAVQRDIPYLSKYLEPYRTPDGKLSTRGPYSYLAPYDIGRENEEYADMLRMRQDVLKANTLLNSNDGEYNKDALGIANSIVGAASKSELQSAMDELKKNPQLADSVMAILKKQGFYAMAMAQPYLYLKDKPTEQAKLLYSKIVSARTKTELREAQEFIGTLKEAGVLDPDTLVKLTELLKEEALQGARR